MDDEDTTLVVHQRGVVQTRGIPASSEQRAQANYADLIGEANHKYERLGAIKQMFDSPKKLERGKKSAMSPDYTDYQKELAEIYALERDLTDLDYWIGKKSTLTLSPFVRTRLDTGMVVYLPKTAQASSQQQTMQVYTPPTQATPAQTTDQPWYVKLQEEQVAHYRPMIMAALDAITKEFITPSGKQSLTIVKRDKKPHNGSGHYFLDDPDKEKLSGVIAYFWQTVRQHPLATTATQADIIRVILRMESRYAKKSSSDEKQMLTDLQRAILNSALDAAAYQQPIEEQVAALLKANALLQQQVNSQQVVPAANSNSPQVTQLQLLADTQAAKIRELEADITRRNAADQQVALVGSTSTTALVPIGQSTVTPDTGALIQKIQHLEELVAVLRHTAQQSEKNLSFTQTALSTSQGQVTALTSVTQDMSATMASVSQAITGKLSARTAQAPAPAITF